jgi:hypothetical protein
MNEKLIVLAVIILGIIGISLVILIYFIVSYYHGEKNGKLEIKNVKICEHCSFEITECCDKCPSCGKWL